MTRLMILAVIVVVMGTVVVQNQSGVALTILGAQQTAEIPFGLLLVIAFSVGALLTIFLYGLVGLHRPSVSKYQPMGRRVPYPDSPSSPNLPNSGPSTGPTSSVAPPYATASQGYSKSSTAFVSEPATTDTAASAQDSYGTVSDTNSSYRSQTYNMPAASTGADSLSNPSDVRSSSASSTPSTVVDISESEKKKSRFGIGRKSEPEPEADKLVGDDWGELRTAEHLNSWNAGEVRRASGISDAGGKRGLLDFMGIGSSAKPRSADQLTEDIAAGWSESASGYAGAGGYTSDEYAGAYGDEYASGYAPEYSEPDALDSGWDHAYSQPTDQRTDAGDVAAGATDYSSRVYQDGIYSDRYDEGPYESDEMYEEGPEEGPEEGVFEADYRVIVPPSKPLDEVPGEESDGSYA